MDTVNNTFRRRGTAFLVIVGLIAVLLLGFLACRAFFCPLAEGTSLGGVDLSGLSAYEARKALTAALEETLYRQNLTVALPEETLVLSPEESGVRVDLTKALQDVLHLPGDTSAPQRSLSLQPYLTVEEDTIRAALNDYAQRWDTELTQPSWILEGVQPNLSTDGFDESLPCQTLVVTMGLPSCHLDVDGVYDSILTAYADAVTLCREEAYLVNPEVLPEVVPDAPDAEAIGKEVSVEPVNDALDRETYSFIPGSYGLRVDEAQLQAAIREAGYGETFALSLQYVRPEIMGEDTYFQDVLGAYETKHTDNRNRNTNLALLCQALDGYVLQPGEEFSFNGVVGERTAERGYKPAPAYSGKRLVDSIGGGVCQGSTTLYNCVLLADLEVVFRACHGATVGYVPLGLDASVNFLTTDFKFRNNWNFPVKIRAEVTDGYVKMKLLGTDEKDYYIKMATGRGEDDLAFYARSWKCKYDKVTNEEISRETEAFSTYYKDVG